MVLPPCWWRCTKKKGIAIGIENAIRFFLGIDITAITAFTGTTLILGESELGIDWELGPSNLFARYAFDVEVDVPLSDAERRQIHAIVDYLKTSPHPLRRPHRAGRTAHLRPLGARRQRAGGGERAALTAMQCCIEPTRDRETDRRRACDLRAAHQASLPLRKDRHRIQGRRV